MALPKVDVVIIGVGAAGGVLAKELAVAGLKVVGLERGRRYSIEDRHPHDELRFWGRFSLFQDPKTEPVTWRPDDNSPAIRQDPIVIGNQVGGAQVHWGAMSWRLHEDDFHILSKYGPQPDTNMADWPVTYAELEPYYDKAEKEIGVCGKAGNLNGQIVEGGNPFEAPRQNEYPMPALEAGCVAHVFDPAAKALGYHPFPSPAGIASVAYQGLPGCNYCGFCQSFGCHIDAKRNTLITTIPTGEATGNLEIRTRCKVFRINVDDTGKATGVSYYDPSGAAQEQPASLVILTSFTYENVRLLLSSKTDKFPNGLSNSSGQVGRNLMAHIAGSALGVFDDQIINLQMGPSAPKRCMDDFGADNFDHTGLGFIRGGVITTWSTFLQGGPLSFTTRLPLPPGLPSWGSQYKEFIKKYYLRYFSLGMQGENLPYNNNLVDLDSNVKDAWGLPAPRVTYKLYDNDLKQRQFLVDRMVEVMTKAGASKVWPAAPPANTPPGPHPMGTTRMGNDPSTSVVNRYCLSWDHPNLFIVGSSNFPSAAGFNPTETINALAYWAAEYIKREVQPGGSLAQYL